MNFSVYIIPIFIFAALAGALLHKKNVFDTFLRGGKDGIQTAVKIFPSLLALIVAIEMFTTSGALDALTALLAKPCALMHIPKEVFPVSLMRTVSGSGAMAMFNDVLSSHGPDSFIGRCASVVMGGSETTFYTLAVYFAATNVKKTRHCVPAALLADLTVAVVGCAVCRVFFGA
ncbi:MAG: spore maturation protein [Clostridia bacterium]|nr:spore maturation protein [Clostridia bacterium]